MIWYSLLIPLIITGIGYLFYKHKIVWWELFIPVVVSFIAVWASYAIIKSYSLDDVEYNGYVIVEARYYEAYETWVDKTCSYTTTCCCDSKGANCQTTTHYYDCSYCDNISARWEMVDSGGNKISITEEKYNSLLKKWSAIPEFVELNRSIVYHFSCGKDGDMYSIEWDNNIETSETSTFTLSFTNILKCNHSAFNYPVVTQEEAAKNGLFEYPQITGYEKQETVLGTDSLNIKTKKLKTYLNYLNGNLGASSKVRIFTLLFKDKPIDAAFLQEAYWDGGNRNEIVVCIGTDKTGKINWVKPFSWCDNKRIVVDIREDLSEIGHLSKVEAIYNAYENNIKLHYHYKSFEDFNYLSFEPTTGQLIFVYLLTVVVSIGSFMWCIKNEINS